MMEGSASFVLSGIESQASVAGAAEKHNECVRQIQSVDQCPLVVDHQHTTHVHNERTADLNENVFASEHDSAQLYSCSESVVQLIHDSGEGDFVDGVGTISNVIVENVEAHEESKQDPLSTTDHVPMDMDNNTSSSSVHGEREETEEEKFDPSTLNYELQVGYKILINLMGAGNRFVNKLFLHPVDDTFPETSEYYAKIKNPIWMTKMKGKFENLEYNDLTEFMADFKLMIENCYRFNGPDNFVSKKAQKLETMMKQKIALLSKDLREKLMGTVSTEDDMLASAGIRRRIRIPNSAPEDDSQALLSQLRRDKAIQEREDRRQRSEDRKALEAARIQEIQNWEDEFLGNVVKDGLKTMWELPQIGLFVYLCMECLGLEEEVTQYQLERGLAAPRESSDFRRLMTCLLSTQNQRKRVKSIMPYSVWNNKLSQKVDYFYKVLQDCGGNHQQASYKLGFDNRAFRMLGKTNPLLRKQFHQLSFLKRVWIFKSYCDYCVESQTYLQKTIEDTEAERPMDVREVLLGSDGRGNRYINFPMFTGKDIRIYRHPKLQEPSLRSLGLEDWSMLEEKPSASSSRCSTPVNQKLSRTNETPISSLRARAILQAAGSKDPSPVRDTSRISPDLQDDNSNSNPASSSLTSETNDSTRGKQSGGYKKRKKSNFYSGKRKRLKAGGSRTDTAALDEFVDSPKVDKGDDQEDSQGFGVPKFQTHKSDKPSEVGDQDCDNNSTSCDVDNSCSSNSHNNSQMNLPQPSANGNNVQHEHSTSLSQSSSYANNTINGHDLSSVQNESKNAEGDNSKVSDDIDGGGKDTWPCHSHKAGDDDTAINKSKNGQNKMDEDRIEGKIFSDGSFPEHAKVEETNGCDYKRNGMSKQEDSCLSTDDSVIKNEGDNKCNGNVSGKEGMQGNVKIEPGAVKEEGDGKMMKCEESGNVGRQDAETKPASGKEEEGTNVKKEAPVESSEMDMVAEVKEEIQEEEEEEDTDEEDLPELGSVELVAESMEEIRNLMNKLSNPEPIKRGKRVYPGVIKPCEEELLGNLTRFHDELLKYERSLLNARIQAQVKLRKEVENYCEPKVEETKGWESEASQSSKESSDDEDGESKKENVNKMSKRSKSKSLKEFLSTAANRLINLNSEGTNEDSNDSYELDISSRGRLRKRRVIPNNTEDTGLKKRKNLNQEPAPASPNETVSPSSTSPAPGSGAANGYSMDAGKALPSHLSSALASSMSASNPAAARPQTATHRSMPCQIVRFVAPNSDGAYRTVRLAGKPNMILSPDKLGSIQFITSTGVVTIPRNQLVTASTTQSSHPVIQNLLNNQSVMSPHRPALQNLPGKTIASPPVGLRQQGGQLLSKILSSTLPGGHALRVSSGNSSAGMPAKQIAKSPSSTPGAVVVTQVSSSFISQGGKQVLDLGNLSVSQIQQLAKNQAIQINTGAGQPTTLLLTTGLQQLASSKAGIASTTLASVSLSSSAQTKDQGGHVLKNQGNVTIIPQTPQLPVIRTIINRPALNPARAPSTASLGSQVGNCPRMPHTGGVSQGMLTVLPGGTVTLQQVPSNPRIISSLNQNLIPSQGLSVAPKDSPKTVTNGKVSNDQQSKANWVSVPTKKYANNVTVKALLENRCAKKNNVDDNNGKCDDSAEALTSYSGSETYNSDFTAGGSQGNQLLDASELNQSHFDIASSMSSSISNCSSSVVSIAGSDISVNEQQSNSSMSVGVGTTPQSLSVDAAIQPLLTSTVQVSLPTVNMKVPSPNTLPSLTHNKHSTTIVQSTKVPIPVASTQESLSPTSQSCPDSLVSHLEQQQGQSIPLSSPTCVVSLPTQPQFLSNNVSLNLPVNSSVMSVNSNVNVNPGVSVPMGVSVNPASGGAINSNSVANLKNVMLKLTPPKGGSGQFVQAYMTPQGKLVIPQAALISQQAQGQQVLQAGPNRVILANSSQALNLQAGQVLQAKPSVSLSGNNTVSLSGNHTINPAQVRGTQSVPAAVNNLNPSMHLLGQQAGGQLVVANAQQTNIVPSNSSSGPVSAQSANQGIKVMLINHATGLQSVQQQQQSSGVAKTAANGIQTSTPASELVKQIVNNTQIQAAAQQQQQNFHPIKKQLVTQALPAANSHQVIQAAAGQGKPLANTILALQQQQGTKAVPLQRVNGQPVHTGVVVGKQAVPSGAPPAAATAMTPQPVQLQHLNHILGPPSAQPPPPRGQVSLPTARSVQQAQMVQLAISPPNAAGPMARAILAQPAARVVQVAGQLSPQIQLTNQNPLQAVTPIPQQVGLIIQPQQQQQATVLPSGQQLVRVQGSGVVQIQPGNALLQQKPAQLSNLPVQPQQQPKSSQVLNAATTGHVVRPVSGNLVQQPQIQFVINPAASSNPGIGLAHLTSPVIHPVIKAIATTTPSQPQSSVLLSTSSSSSSTDPNTIMTCSSSGQVVVRQLPQQVVNSTLHRSANQFIVSPIKVQASQNPQHQPRLVSPIKLMQPEQLVVHNPQQLINLIQTSHSGQQAFMAVSSDNGKSVHSLTTHPTIIAKASSGQQQLVWSSSGSVLSQSTSVSGNIPLQPSLEGIVQTCRVIPSSGTLAINGESGSQLTITNTSLDVAQTAVSRGVIVKQPPQMASGNYGLVSSSQGVGVDVAVCCGMNLPKVSSNLLSSPSSRYSTTAPLIQASISSGKQPGHRRNTFGGGQDAPKAPGIQRHTSVEEPNTHSLTSEEMDEKEAALNLLTLANQPL